MGNCIWNIQNFHYPYPTLFLVTLVYCSTTITLSIRRCSRRFLELTLPAKRRRVAISVTAKKEICQRRAENPEATQSELSQFASDRFGLAIDQAVYNFRHTPGQCQWMEEEDSNNTKKRTGYHEEGTLVMVLQRSFQKPSVSRRNASRKRSRVWATSWRFWRFQSLKGLALGFKHRHKISLRTIQGEAASVSDALVSEGREKLLDDLAGQELCDIYYMDETRLFFRLERFNSTLLSILFHSWG